MTQKNNHWSTDRYVKKGINRQERGMKDTYLTNYVNLVKKYVKPKSKILDIGCGAGLSSKMLSETYEVTGVDHSKPFIEYAKSRFKNITFKYEDARKLSFKDGSFDASMACGFIEHIEEVDVVLGEMVRVVRKNGLMILVSPSWFSPFRAIRGIIRPKGYETMGRNRLQMIGWLAKSVYYTVQKQINPKYIFRNPDIESEKLVGNDIDMVYIANQYDLKNAFEKRKCKVLNLNADTFKFSSIPFLCTWLGVVAIKLP